MINHRYNQRKAWIIAPHFILPIKSGGDIYINSIAIGLSYYLNSINIIGASTISAYSKGKKTIVSQYNNVQENRIIAILKTIIFGTSYQRERFITKKYIEQLKKLKIHDEDIVFISFLSCYSLSQYINKNLKSIYIITHNYDPEYFLNLKQNTNNIIAKLVFDTSIKYIDKTLKKTNHNLVHINENDKKKYEKKYPNNYHFLFEMGIEKIDNNIDISTIIEKWKTKTQKINLGFIGALWAIQNIAAINYLDTYIYPILRDKIPNLNFSIIGSNPTEEIKLICKKNNWKLYNDLEEEEFNKEIKKLHFSILPFKESSGTKIKLLSSLQNLVPAIGTDCTLPNNSEQIPGFFHSDNFNNWVEHINFFKNCDLETYIEQIKSIHAYIGKITFENKANFFLTQI